MKIVNLGECISSISITRYSERMKRSQIVNSPKFSTTSFADNVNTRVAWIFSWRMNGSMNTKGACSVHMSRIRIKVSVTFLRLKLRRITLGIRPLRVINSVNPSTSLDSRV